MKNVVNVRAAKDSRVVTETHAKSQGLTDTHGTHEDARGFTGYTHSFKLLQLT